MTVMVTVFPVVLVPPITAFSTKLPVTPNVMVSVALPLTEEEYVVTRGEAERIESIAPFDEAVTPMDWRLVSAVIFAARLAAIFVESSEATVV
ncbi:MAG: hypothetical protein HC888_16560 [Candidatus Competibacteraceae bacterium]|nr:hypothetical protein [Candidatus Competibacteraceae bacterium]